MKLKFKNQGFQEAATAAVCDVFNGQPYQNPNVYTVDPGRTVASGQWLVFFFLSYFITIAGLRKP